MKRLLMGIMLAAPLAGYAAPMTEASATASAKKNHVVGDEILNNDMGTAETIIGEDPDAPKGDGGINMVFDYAAGCDAEYTDMNHILVPKVEEREMKLKFLLTVPGGIKKFNVQIESDNANFVSALR